MEKKLRNKSKAHEILEEIERIRRENVLVIVEGKHDRQALNRLGISNVYEINQDQVSLFSRIEAILKKLEEKPREKRVAIILTDLDRKGKQLFKIIFSKLQENGVKVSNHLRTCLFDEKISHIEGLASFVENHA